MKNYYVPIVFAFFSIFFSCSKKELNPKDYIQFIEDENNGLKVSKNIGEVIYAVQYKPVDYILLKEKRDANEVGKYELQGMQYYTLTYSLVKKDKDILKSQLESSDEYYERVNYLSFGLQNDIYLVEGADSLKCKLFNYVRSYGLTPQADFVLAFDKKDNIEITDKLLVIEDKIFGGGIIKLKITSSDIKNIPELI